MAYNPYDSPRGTIGRFASTTRRQFLLLMGAIAGLAAVIFGGVQSLKFLFPGATGDAPPDFKLDQDPSSIAVGQVLQITDKRVSVIRDKEGFYAVLLICTHLGCTPNYVTDVLGGTGVTRGPANDAHYKEQSSSAQNGWACPCHGSRYYIDSTNFYGPAPRPMDWLEISFTLDNKLSVDRSKLVASRGAGDTDVPTWRLDPETKKVKGSPIGV